MNTTKPMPKYCARVATQLAFGLAGLAVFVLASGVAAFSSMFVADRMGWRGPWVEVKEKNGVVPFEVEYQPTPVRPSEYFRRVAFASGKRVGIAMSTGRDPQLVVYALGDGRHALMDIAGHLFRVDASAETVDMEAEKRWVRLPDGTVGVTDWGSMGGVAVILENGGTQTVKGGVPVGESLDGRRLLGKIVPYGRFVDEAEDWLTEKLTPAPWEGPPNWPDELPFAVERQTGKFHSGERWRVAFPSGKAVALATMWDGPYSVQELADGNYVLKREREKEHEIPTKLYRVRPGDECVDMLFRDDWQEIPTDILQVTAWGSLGIRGRNADEEEVCGTNSMPVGTTLEVIRPVGWLLKNGMFARGLEEEGSAP